MSLKATHPVARPGTAARMVLAASLCAGALLVSACGTAEASVSASPNNPGANSAATAAPAQLATPEPIATLPAGSTGEPIVARVNGEDITLETFTRELARAEQYRAATVDTASLQDSVLETLIQEVLLTQSAAQQGIAISETDLDVELGAARTMAGSDEAWQGWLAANLYTEAEFREDLRGALNASRVRDIVLQGYSPSGVPFVRARHILVATEAEASALLERLRSGEDFAALASQFTRDETTRGSGGDLGWFHEAQLLQPELARLAFTLEMSIIAGPIRTELGYHILQVLERENRPVSEEEYAAVAQAHFENWLFGLANDAMIERYL